MPRWRGLPLVKAANWLNHLEYDWQSPIWSHLREIAAEYRLIRYDARGNGLSDWDVADISFAAFVRDLERGRRLPDSTGSRCSASPTGCAASIAYAVRHPERVTRLVLYGGYARGRRRGSQREIENSDAVLTLMRDGWGQENPFPDALHRVSFRAAPRPDAVVQRPAAQDHIGRRTQYVVGPTTTSMSGSARARRVPTLVLHCRDDAAVAFEEGADGAGIPGAQLVELDGSNHLILESDPAWGRFMVEIREFLRV